MIHLVDYPQTTEEALALSRYSHSLNGVFVVSEIPKSDADDEEEEAIAEEEEDMEGSDHAEGEEGEQEMHEADGKQPEEKKEQAKTPDSAEE